MAYSYKELESTHKDQLIHLLHAGFSRRREFWENSINMLIDYHNFINDEKIGYGLFFDEELVGAIIIINDISTETASLSSLYVKDKHRARSLPFLKNAIDSIDRKQINNFSATDDAIKILKMFGFNVNKKSCNIRIPLPVFSRIKITRAKEKDAREILNKNKIFDSNNLRVLKIRNGFNEKIVILKDLSILKNNNLRVLSSVIFSEDLIKSELKTLVFYNFLKGKFLFDFFDPELTLSIESNRFRIVSKGQTKKNYFSNSEYSLFDF